MPGRKGFFFIGVLLFFLFIIFSYLVHENVFTSSDFNTTVRLQDNISRRFDNEFSWFSVIGNFESMLIFLIAVLILARRFLAGVVAFSMFGTFHVVELFGKFFVNHPPPPEFLLRTERLVNFPQFHVRLDYSYPSGHAGRAAFISILLIALILQSKKINKLLKTGLIGLIVCYNAAMFVSRIYLGEHWASDVIGGVLLGGALGAISGGVLASNFKSPISNSKSQIRQKSK